jgi:hypothetical protein
MSSEEVCHQSDVFPPDKIPSNANDILHQVNGDIQWTVITCGWGDYPYLLVTVGTWERVSMRINLRKGMNQKVEKGDKRKLIWRDRCVFSD